MARPGSRTMSQSMKYAVLRSAQHFTSTVLDVTKLTTTSLAINSIMLSVLSLIVSFVIAFKSSNSFQRWAEGRTRYSNIADMSRQLVTTIWLQVPNGRHKESASELDIGDVSRENENHKEFVSAHDSEAIRGVIEKKTYIGLVQAFSLAIKHGLRGESGPFYSDLYPLIAFLPKYHPSHYTPVTRANLAVLWEGKRGASNNPRHIPLTFAKEEGLKQSNNSPFDTSHFSGHTVSQIPIHPPCDPPKSRVWDYIPPLRYVANCKDILKYDSENGERARFGRRKRAGEPRMEIAQEILTYLTAYAVELKAGDNDNGSASSMLSAIGSLQTEMNELERLATTPIPVAYEFHLRMTVWLFLFFLPFQIVSALEWVTIPATTIAAITYLGYLEIGGRIDSPFGYDRSDLEQDKYTAKIAKQISEVLAFPIASCREIVFSDLNQPFLPTMSLTANQLVNGNGRKGDKEPAPIRSVRDLHVILHDNHSVISQEVDSIVRGDRDCLTQATGLEVNVLAR